MLVLQALFTQFHSRVSFGVKAECIELTEIPQVRSARARALFKAGLRTPQAVAEASVEEIASALAAGGGAGSRGLQLANAKKIRTGKGVAKVVERLGLQRNEQGTMLLIREYFVRSSLLDQKQIDVDDGCQKLAAPELIRNFFLPGTWRQRCIAVCLANF